MTPYLFVYGTLMSHTGTVQAQQLAAEASSLGQASMTARLFRISWYPGLVDGDGTVHGEVFRLNEPAHTLRWLDAYEGITPASAGAAPGPTAPADEYERVLREVRLASGDVLQAWVYLYRKDVFGCMPVADGRWVG